MTQYCLYRMFDDQNNLLYVGQSIRLAERMHQHSKDKSWWPPKRIEIEQYENANALNEAERQVIQTEKPLHNVMHNGKINLRRTPTVSNFTERELRYNSDWACSMTEEAWNGLAPANIGIAYDLSDTIVSLNIRNEYLTALHALIQLRWKIHVSCNEADENVGWQGQFERMFSWMTAVMARSTYHTDLTGHWHEVNVTDADGIGTINKRCRCGSTKPSALPLSEYNPIWDTPIAWRQIYEGKHAENIRMCCHGEFIKDPGYWAEPEGLDY